MIKTLTFLISICISLYAINIHAQETFEVVVDTDGNGRLIGKFENLNNSALSSGRLSINSGTSSNQGSLELSAFANSYTASPGYSGYGVISNRTEGILLRSINANGNIRFATGGSTLSINTRMFINSLGQVGFGTDVPAKKIHLKEGDLYLDTASGSEVIMKSPDGSCFSVTVTNQGSLNTTPTSGGCPVATN